MGLVWLSILFYFFIFIFFKAGVDLGLGWQFFPIFLKFWVDFRQDLWKYLHIFFILGIFGKLFGWISFTLLFCFGQTWGRFLAFYTFVFVFQAYLVASLEARFSHLFVFGYGNLGGHLWSPSLKGFSEHIWGMLMDFFQKDLNHKSHFWSFLSFILVIRNNFFWS